MTHQAKFTGKFDVHKISKHDFAMMCEQIAHHEVFKGRGFDPQPLRRHEGGIELLGQDHNYKQVRFPLHGIWPNLTENDSTQTWVGNHELLYNSSTQKIQMENGRFYLKFQVDCAKNHFPYLKWTKLEMDTVKQIFDDYSH